MSGISGTQEDVMRARQIEKKREEKRKLFEAQKDMVRFRSFNHTGGCVRLPVQRFLRDVGVFFERTSWDSDFAPVRICIGLFFPFVQFSCGSSTFHLLDFLSVDV